MLRVQTICRLGQDATINNVSGRTVINFSAAYSEKYKNNDGAEVNNTTWMSCSYWTEKTAIAAYLKKGGQVFIEGKPEVKTYTNKEGQQVPQLVIRVSSIKLLSSPEQSQQQPQAQQVQPKSFEPADDDMPF